MTSITSFAEALAVLETYVPQQTANTGKHFRLERMQPMLHAIGDPHEKLRIVHIAGTSGKTSTTYYITALLTAAGQKVGTTVSPHIDSVTERVQINGRPISEEDFYTSFNEFMQLLDTVDMQPTYFEILVGFAYWYFVREGVDYAVIETGLGGLLDATNVASREDKVCVITDIGYDHMQILGDTLPEIAAQKAGIIHEGNVSFMHPQSPEIMQVFESKCQETGAKLVNVPVQVVPVPDIADFQKRNWQLAYTAYRYVQERDKLPELTDHQLLDTLYVKVPGRMDERYLKGKVIIMDGAHNAQKMQAFVSGFKQKYPRHNAAVLLSMKQGKDHADVLPVLAEITDKLILTSFVLVQDTPLHSMDLEQLAAEARKYVEDVEVVPDQNAAYEQLLASGQDILVITGSFYLIGQLRQQHKELINAGR